MLPPCPVQRCTRAAVTSDNLVEIHISLTLKATDLHCQDGETVKFVHSNYTQQAKHEILEELHFSHCTILTSDFLLLLSFLCCSKSLPSISANNPSIVLHFLVSRAVSCELSCQKPS